MSSRLCLCALMCIILCIFLAQICQTLPTTECQKSKNKTEMANQMLLLQYFFARGIAFQPTGGDDSSTVDELAVKCD
uniref:Secreted protein n=1 Tax=Globodera rostochiensis TaxID=31243 RepID=A0A914GST0_GLORO